MTSNIELYIYSINFFYDFFALSDFAFDEITENASRINVLNANTIEIRTTTTSAQQSKLYN